MRDLIKPINVEAFDLVRQANVEVHKNEIQPRGGGKPFVTASIVVNGKYAHEFSPRSRVSQALLTMEPEALAARLNGGSFFFINGQLVDFRDAAYEQSGGFFQSQESIEKMIELIGVRVMRRGARNELHTHVSLCFRILALEDATVQRARSIWMATRK